MKFTWITASASAVAGIVVFSRFGLRGMLLCAVILLFALVIELLRTRAVDLTIIALAGVFTAGAVSYAFAELNVKSTRYINRYVTLGGVIVSQARQSDSDENYRYTLKIKNIDKNGQKETASETILLTTPTLLHCGESVTVRGIVKSIQGQMNENGFDAKLYYKSQNIFTRIYSEDIAAGGGYKALSPAMAGAWLRERVDDCIYKYCRGDGAAIISAVLTGNMHHFSKELNDSLNSTALKRALHPAYLQLMLLSMLMGLMSGIVRKRFRDGALVIIILAAAVFGSSQIGFVKCMLVCVMSIIDKQANRTETYSKSLAKILLIFAAVSPMTIFNSGFIISCVSGAVIKLFVTPKRQYRLSAANTRFGRTVLTMIVCTLIMTPISALYFNGFCIYAPLVSILMIPLTLTIIVSAPLSFVMTALFGHAPIIAAYLRMAVWLMLLIPSTVEKLPLAFIVVPTPSVTQILALSAAAAAAYFVMRKNHSAAKFSALCCGALSTSIVICALCRAGTTDFMFVNVGQGDGAVIHTAFGDTIIIDGGGGSAFSDYNPGEEIFVPYLESKGFGKIKAAFVSHFDKDHVQGVIAAIKTLNVEKVYAPRPEADWDEGMTVFARELEAAAANNDTEVHYISEDTSIPFRHGLNLDIYAPNEKLQKSDEGNDSSLLMRACYGDTAVLYTGDMSATGEREFLNDGTYVRADVLKVGHHGSKTSTSAEWIDAVDPTYAVISCGENNNYGHPSKDVLARLSGRTILRTDTMGDIKITADKRGIKRVSVLNRSDYGKDGEKE